MDIRQQARTTHMRQEVTAEIFTDFFALGEQENLSPFLQADSRNWSINLTLKASFGAAFLLILAFICSFFQKVVPLSHILLIMVYFLAGIPALIEAIEDLLDGDINIDILMTLAAFSSVLIGSGMEGGLLLVLFALSGAMEDAVTTKAKDAISQLHKLAPTKACVIEPDGVLIEKSIKDITIGTMILVKAGQVVPLDGIVMDGVSSVNLVHLTGENLPVTKLPLDTVPAGARNLDGALTVEVTHTNAESTLARIIELVTQAQAARPVLQRFFDRLSRSYAMTIIGLTALFALTFPYLLNIPFLGIEGSLYRSIAFLIAASPCALIIAIPIAYLSAVSACANHGILVKGGMTLDALANCHKVAFDKTGTLTTGELTCFEIEALIPNEAISTETALTIAYMMERNAVHPIATAITNYAEKQITSINPPPISQFKSIPGYGIEAFVDFQGKAQPVYIGRPAYIAEKLNEGLCQRLLTRTSEIEELGELLTVLMIGTALFIFHFRDTPRKNVSHMLAAIKQRGLSTVMLTGDHFSSAQRTAKELHINQFYAGLTPEQKLKYIVELSKKNDLAMIGDGVNDAPALARATVGICMGKVGSATAIDAADIILLNDNIEMLDWLFGKAKDTQIIVRQNLFLAMTAILVASIPALSGFVPLWLAVVMHEGGTVLVGLNALRLLKR